MKDIITLLRPHQYVKNLFVFMPLIFALNLNLSGFTETALVFVLFSMLSSSVYVINDYCDIREDRRHPTKKNRPLASGAVSIKSGFILSGVLSSSSLVAAYFLNSELLFVLLFYFLLNIAYSYKLKHIPVVDIFVIATGFVLRLFAGASVTNTHLSMWIVIITFLLAIFLALAKRRDDVLLSMKGHNTRKSIDGYNLEFVNASMTLMAAVVIVSYLQYTVSAEVIGRIGSDNLFFSAFFVILGILRYMQITFVEGKSGSPTKIVLKDRFMQISILLWLISFYAIVKIQ